MDFKKFFQTNYPHLLAIVLFLLVTSIVFYPSVFEGKVLNQSDITQWKGMSHEIEEYREQTGKEPLWTNAMFGGMPSFLISTEYPSNFTGFFEKIFSLFLPRPLNIVFLLFLGFYVLLATQGIKSWISMVGAIAFGLSTFFLISLEAGHNNKILAIAYLAPSIAGVLLAFRGKIFPGAALFALSLAMGIHANHVQITYYLAITILILGITQLVISVMDKQLIQFSKAAFVLIIAAMIAVAPNISLLETNYNHTKETIRGGKSELSYKADAQGGVDIEYATRWSQGKWETLTTLIPRLYGGASGEYFKPDSEVGKLFQQKEKFQFTGYWGSQPFTSGPIYFGAIIFFLAILGMFVIRNPLKWGIFAVIIFFVLLSWGKNLSGFYSFFFDHLPKFKMFRTPSMALAIPALLLPFLGMWAIKEIFDSPNRKLLLKKFYYAAGITIGTILLVGFLAKGSYSFEGENEMQKLGQSIGSNDPGTIKQVLTALKEDRAKMLTMDSLRSLFFVVFVGGMLWAFITDRLKNKTLITAVAGVLIFIDLFFVDHRYLNGDDYEDKQKYEAQFLPGAIDQQIAQFEKGNKSYRVHNLTVDPFNNAMQSYHQHTIGGYHPTKLIRYQDLIENHIAKGSMPVINMLNTKYFIVDDKQTGKPVAQLNSGACGDAWFVSEIKKVENADEEMEALGEFNPKKTVVIDKRFDEYLQGFNVDFDSTATIQLTTYEPGHLIYEYNCSKEQFAVFSEIYYAAGNGWKVKLNGQDAEHIRVNYVLRGMRVPAGSGTIEFNFKPDFYVKSEKAALGGSILLVLFVVGCFAYPIISKRKQNS